MIYLSLYFRDVLYVVYLLCWCIRNWAGQLKPSLRINWIIIIFAVDPVDPPPPQIPPFSGLAKKRRYWKTAVKGVTYKYNMYNQEKTYSGLENQLQYILGGGPGR